MTNFKELEKRYNLAINNFEEIERNSSKKIKITAIKDVIWCYEELGERNKKTTFDYWEDGVNYLGYGSIKQLFDTFDVQLKKVNQKIENVKNELAKAKNIYCCEYCFSNDEYYHFSGCPHDIEDDIWD